jgi:hypothetical protein
MSFTLSNEEFIVMPVDLGGNIVLKPSEDDIARRGPRRLVKLVPLPGNHAAPAIWVSPYIFDDHDLKVPCHHVIVILSKGPPSTPMPQTTCVTIPKTFYDKLPDVPCEW